MKLPRTPSYSCISVWHASKPKQRKKVSQNASLWDQAHCAGRLRVLQGPGEPQSDKWKEEVRQKDIFYALDNDEADHDGMEVVTIAVTGDDDEE